MGSWAGLQVSAVAIAHVRCIKILTWFRGFLVILRVLYYFGLVFFVLNTLLGIAQKWSREKLQFCLRVIGILIYRMWAIWWFPKDNPSYICNSVKKVCENNDGGVFLCLWKCFIWALLKWNDLSFSFKTSSVESDYSITYMWALDYYYYWAGFYKNLIVYLFTCFLFLLEN